MDPITPLSIADRALGAWDYGIIAFYALLIATIGPLCLRLNRNPSDYFRGGGNMLWWVGAVSSMAVAISTWSFTGGAAKVYLDGFVYPLAAILATIPCLIVLWFVVPRFRRLRVITAMEAVFRRFGFGTEQFYTWFTLPMGLFWGSIGLNTLGVFMSAIFRMDLAVTIVIVGVLVTSLAVIGGQWAISFFAVVQGAILLMVVIMVAAYSLALPQIGGPVGLLEALPPQHTQFELQSSTTLIWLWIAFQGIFTVISQIDLRNSAKYIRVKDELSTRKMLLMATLPNLILLLPLLMQIPSLCAAVVYPDLKEVFPQLKSPEEGAWLAMAMTVLPQGLLGLMVCAMFGAAADSLDAALNSNAGFFVRNVYIRYLDPRATDRRQILVGKLTTAAFGLVTIGLALMVNSLRSLNLFDLFQVLNAVLLPPMIVPMVLGLFIKRTPAWSGWSTVVAGLLAGMASHHFYSSAWIGSLLGIEGPLSTREIVDSRYIYVSLVTFSVSSLWFLATSFFWNRSNQEHRTRVESLFSDLARPVNHLGEGGEDQDGMQYRITGMLSLVMGGFLLLCTLIPNPPAGRISFLLIGGVLFLMGAAFHRNYRKLAKKARTQTPTPPGAA